MENCEQVTKQILALLEIPYTSKYLKNAILSHLDHPSLLAVSDTLNKYHIDILAVKIDADKLGNMPLPCIIQVEVNRMPLLFVLQSLAGDYVSYYDDKGKFIKTTKEAFFKTWTGVCLLVETSEDSKEEGIEKKLSKKKVFNLLRGSIALLFLSWIVISFLNSESATNVSFAAYTIIYSVLKGIGLAVGFMLLWFEVDQYNPTLQSFCTGGGGKVNCNAVLNSKYAKLFNDRLSLSALGFSYFFGTFIYLIISGFSFTSLSLLGLFSFSMVPIIAISVYYQAVIIKQWCKFCIIIQAVLIAEIIVVFFGTFYKTNISLEILPLLLALFLIPIMGWKLIKPLLEQEKETNIHKRGLKKIKNNPDVLEGLLIKSRKIETSTEGLGISINNNGAKYHIIKVCNPYCGPCAKAHPILEDLVNDGIINMQILFTARTVQGRMAKPVSHFLAIDAQGDKHKTQTALEHWYQAEQKDYDLFASKYPLNGELEKQNGKIDAMRQWCDAENITHTPTIFVNGYELPKEYSIEDLKEVLQ